MLTALEAYKKLTAEGERPSDACRVLRSEYGLTADQAADIAYQAAGKKAPRAYADGSYRPADRGQDQHAG